MKNDPIYTIPKKHPRRHLRLPLIIIACMLIMNITAGQDANDGSSKVSFTLNMSSLVSNGSRTLKIKAGRKENKKNIPVYDIRSPFNLYLGMVKPHDPSDGSGWISKTYLDSDGEGVFLFPADFYSQTAGQHEFTFIVTMKDDPKYEDVEESITVTDAKISMVYSGDDSVKTATATLTAWQDSTYVPVPEAELKLCIRRTFNFLLFGEAGVLTDSSGQVSGSLPMDLPGNADATLSIFGRIEDHESYGTVEGGITVPWAILPKKNPEKGRTLWSSGDNAPLVLVVSSVAIILIIWGTILYLVYLLVKIKRLGKSPNS